MVPTDADAEGRRLKSFPLLNANIFLTLQNSFFFCLFVSQGNQERIKERRDKNSLIQLLTSSLGLLL